MLVLTSEFCRLLVRTSEFCGSSGARQSAVACWSFIPLPIHQSSELGISAVPPWLVNLRLRAGHSSAPHSSIFRTWDFCGSSVARQSAVACWSFIRSPFINLPNLGFLRFLRGSSICGCVLVIHPLPIHQSSELGISAVPPWLVNLRLRAGHSSAPHSSIVRTWDFCGSSVVRQSAVQFNIRKGPTQGPKTRFLDRNGVDTT